MKEYNLFGISICDTTINDTIELLKEKIQNYKNSTTSVFFVNTHTLNLAIKNNEYKKILNSSDYVFGDGTGVRWAMRYINKVRLMDNVNGTDLIPMFFKATTDFEYKCFLLGATEEEIIKSVDYFDENFKKWSVSGYQHGYFSKEQEDNIIKMINNSGSHLLLVGMGNPLQEQWIIRNRDRLKIPIVAGTGGLFTYWAGNLERAPLWMRRMGIEWVHILLSQPFKWKRYLMGNAYFLFQIAKEVCKRKFC